MTREEIRKHWLHECNAACETAQLRMDRLKEMDPDAPINYYADTIPPLGKPGGILLKEEQLKEIVMGAFKAGYNHK